MRLTTKLVAIGSLLILAGCLNKYVIRDNEVRVGISAGVEYQSRNGNGQPMFIQQMPLQEDQIIRVSGCGE